MLPSDVSISITQDEEGKPVVGAEGEDIGVVASVQGGTAHVRPDPGLAETVKARLGWEEAAADTYPVQPEMIDSVSANEVQLRYGLGAE